MVTSMFSKDSPKTDLKPEETRTSRKRSVNAAESQVGTMVVEIGGRTTLQTQPIWTGTCCLLI